MKPAILGPSFLFFFGGLLPASVAGATFGPAFSRSDRRAIEHIREHVLERVQRKEHAKLIEATDLFVDHTDASAAVEVTSKYYAVKTTNASLGRGLGARLDAQLVELQDLLETDHVPTRRFPILILPTIEDYAAVAKGRADEHSSFYGSYFARHESSQPVICVYDPRYNWTQVPHSAVHQFVASAFRTSPPPWISEGLAHYFALKVNREAREWAEGEHPLRAASYRPLRELIEEPDLSRYGNATTAEARLVQLGLFFRYLLEEFPETAWTAPGEPEAEASFVAYLRGVVRGREPRKGFRQVFLTPEGIEFLDASFREFRFGS